jgi:iron complex outermembrane receptor protein
MDMPARSAQFVAQHRIQALMGGGSLLALISLFQAGAASAQTTLGQQPSAAQMSEVVVTAQKRIERALDVPAAVTALSAAQLQRAEAVRLSDFQAMVPGLELVSDREGETQIVIRGITTGQMTPTTTVSTYVDDTPYGSSTAFALGGQLTPDLDPSDVQRVEVLRGPQGTLYGASALGGLVKYVTTPPNLTNYAARVEVDGSTVDHGGDGYGVRGMVNLPLISDTLGLRVSGFDRQDPGYINDPNLGRTDVNTTQVYGGRASLLWDPIKALSVRLSVQMQNVEGKGTDDEDVDASSLKPLYGDLNQLRYINEPLDIRYRVYSGVVKYDLGWADLTSATSYTTLHESLTTDLTDTYQPVLGPLLGAPNLGIGFVTPINQEKTTQEIRLSSPSEQKLEWISGLFFTHEASSHGEQFDPFLTGSNTPIPVNLLTGSLNSRYTEYAGYGDVTYHFTQQFSIQAGVRYSTNNQTYSQPESGALIGPPNTLHAKSSDDSTTFLVTPKYQFDSNNMVYARVATGYRAGGPNALTPAEIAGGVPTSYRPDTLTNYEVGYKAAALEHSLTLDISAFYIDWRNIQLQTVFNGFDATGNGGTARSDGFEGAVTYTPIRGLNLSGNVAYTDSQLTQNAPGVDGKNGDELPNVPRWAAHIGADYDFPLAMEWNGFVGGGVRYLGDRETGFVSGASTTFVRPTIPAYTTVDLHAGISDKTWTLELYAKNIGDTRGINNLSSLSFTGTSNPYEASIIQPRTIGVSLSASY